MGVLKKINYFMYGAGSLFFFVTMLVAAAYSGLLFTDIDHEVGRDTYGRTGSLYSCLLGILVLSLVCCVIFGITFVFSLCNILKCVRVILNFVGVVFFIGVLICEALFVVFYAYQGEPYPDAYAYCKNSDFVEHMSHFSTIYQHCGESGSNSNSINEVSEGENKINALSKKQYLDFTIENLKILGGKTRKDITDEIKLIAFKGVVEAALTQYKIDYVYLNEDKEYHSASLPSCRSDGNKTMTTDDKEIMTCIDTIFPDSIEDLTSDNFVVTGCDRLNF